MKAVFLKAALEELNAAVDFYEERREGLGREFAQAVEQATGKALAHPRAWTSLSSRCRRIMLRRFPYGLVYQIRGDELLIVEVMHTSRRPGYWEARASGD